MRLSESMRRCSSNHSFHALAAGNTNVKGITTAISVWILCQWSFGFSQTYSINEGMAQVNSTAKTSQKELPCQHVKRKDILDRTSRPCAQSSVAHDHGAYNFLLLQLPPWEESSNGHSTS